jgi:hypothetical protein
MAFEFGVDVCGTRTWSSETATVRSSRRSPWTPGSHAAGIPNGLIDVTGRNDHALRWLVADTDLIVLTTSPRGERHVR